MAEAKKGRCSPAEAQAETSQAFGCRSARSTLHRGFSDEAGPRVLTQDGVGPIHNALGTTQ